MYTSCPESVLHHMEVITVDQQLMNFFKFDQADLIANQNGQFTEKQKVRLLQEDKKLKGKARLHSIPFLLIAVTGPFTAIAPKGFFGWGWVLTWGLVWTGLWGAIGLFMFLGSLGKPQPLVLAKTKGHVRIVNYQIRIGHRSFDVEGNPEDVLIQGNEYIVYYEKNWEEIVSAERISTTQTSAGG